MPGWVCNIGDAILGMPWATPHKLGMPGGLPEPSRVGRGLAIISATVLLLLRCFTLPYSTLLLYVYSPLRLFHTHPVFPFLPNSPNSPTR